MKNIHQIVLPINLEIIIPKDDSVRLLYEVTEGLNYKKLYRSYSILGRNSAIDPKALFRIVVYGYMERIFSSRELEKACIRDVNFRWLLQGQKAPSHNTIARFKSSRMKYCLEDLFNQLVLKLNEKDEIKFENLFIDGTKIEANANRYTFVWRGTLNYHLAGLLDAVDSVYQKYNTLIDENEYSIKYDIPHAHMFVIEGMEKVRDVIEKNRTRKLTKHKKLSNNTIIEIDNCSPLEILKLQKNLIQIAEQEHITFVYGKGKRKSEIQQLYEELESCGERLMGYKECFEIMGKDRNSYSKTDLEATFMRMKEDHMKNGQLKAAYNVQIAVENYFIVQAYVSNDRTDYNTLIPVLEKHKNAFGEILGEVTADSGYCSEKNLLYLKKHKISSYIKLQDHEKRKTRAYTEEIGKYYNMKTQIFEDELYYICHDGRELHHIRTEKKEQAGYTQTFEVYGCSDCSGCRHKEKCLYKYDAEKDAEKNKVMKINEQWEALKEESHGNIQSEKGILNRQIRSIQTEGQ